jgi:hypothetical protein
MVSSFMAALLAVLQPAVKSRCGASHHLDPRAGLSAKSGIIDNDVKLALG